jgi:XRN 5'-3' exonuclease N-terminus
VEEDDIEVDVNDDVDDIIDIVNDDDTDMIDVGIDDDVGDDDIVSNVSTEEVCESICYDLDRVVTEIVQLAQLVYMAIDGVAPRAKFNQQRAGRYRSASEGQIKQTVYDAHVQKRMHKKNGLFQFEEEGEDYGEGRQQQGRGQVTNGDDCSDAEDFISIININNSSSTGTQHLVARAGCCITIIHIFRAILLSKAIHGNYTSS